MKPTNNLIVRRVIDGEEMVCVAPWYWEQINECLIKDEQVKAFNEALDAPPKDIPALRELLTTDPLSGTPDGLVE